MYTKSDRFKTMSKNKKAVRKQISFYNSKNPGYLKYEQNIPYARYLVGKMVSVLGGMRKRVFEVGAGQGRFSFELARFVGELTATDISSLEISLYKKQQKMLGVKNSTSFTYNALEKVKRIGKQYDHVVGFFVLHHIQRVDYDLLVKNLSKLLKNGGTFTFIEPNNLYPFHIVEILIEKDMHWDIEKQIYTDYIGKLKKACLQNGFVVKISRKFGFIPPPLINKSPYLTKIDSFIEKIPLLNQVFCPFILLSLQKTSEDESNFE